jgi:hypothetical protein
MEDSFLYRVSLKGMTYDSTGAPYGEAYVIASDPTAAYLKLRKFIDTAGLNGTPIGFSHERELDKVELIAATGRYPDCRMRLFL